MTPPTPRSWLVAPSPLVLQCWGDGVDTGVSAAVVVELRR